jgi:transcriptional regulator with GAF, ATPase, and Fis domain
MRSAMALSSEVTNPCPSSVGSVSSPPLARGPDGFERIVGLMLSRLSHASADELPSAVADSLLDLCRVGSLALACVLEPVNHAPDLGIRVEASLSGLSASSLFTNVSELTHQRVRSELAWCSPCVIDAEDPQPELGELGSSLRAHGLRSSAIARLDLEGRPFGCLVLASNGRNLLDGSTFSRVRLLADLMALALARQDAVRAANDRARPSQVVLTDADVRALERSNLLLALERSGWKVQGPTGAARALGLSPSTLRDRMKSFGLRRP